jgi:hypothetical protein
MRKKARLTIASAQPTVGGKEIPCILGSIGLSFQFVEYFNSRIPAADARRELAEGIFWLFDQARFFEVEVCDLTGTIIALGLDEMRHNGVPIEKVRAYWKAALIFCDWLQHADLASANVAASVPDPALGLYWTDGANAAAAAIEVPVREVTSLLRLA